LPSISLHVDHVAGRERRGATPGHAGALGEDHAELALADHLAGRLAGRLKADPGLGVRGLQHHGEAPGLHVAERRHVGQGQAPLAADEVDLGLRAAEAAGLVEAHEPVRQRLARHGLELRVEGGAHRQAALVKLLLAVAVGDLAADLLGEEAGGDGVRRDHAGVDVQRQLLRLVRLRPRRVAVGHHQVDDVVAPAEGILGAAEGVVVVRSLGERREVGGLLQVELVDGLAVEVERRGGDAVIAEAEIDLVQVELEDAVLGEGRLDPERDQGLADFTVKSLLVVEQEVLRHLLGDGGGALLLAGAEIGQHGADHALRVDAGMLVEILVLRREEGALDHRRHRLDRQV
jgi:hypothetical protein